MWQRPSSLAHETPPHPKACTPAENPLVALAAGGYGPRPKRSAELRAVSPIRVRRALTGPPWVIGSDSNRPRPLGPLQSVEYPRIREEEASTNGIVSSTEGSRVQLATQLDQGGVPFWLRASAAQPPGAARGREGSTEVPVELFARQSLGPST